MKTFEEFLNEVKKERVIGTFKDAHNAKVVVIVARGPVGKQLNVAISADDNTKPKVIAKAINRRDGKTIEANKMTDAEIIKALKKGPWASTFKQAGGVNWVK